MKNIKKGQIEDLLNDILIQNEKINALNTLIDDKLQSIETFTDNEVSFMLYNAQRNIRHYILLDYIIQDMTKGIENNVIKLQKLLKALDNEK